MEPFQLYFDFHYFDCLAISITTIFLVPGIRATANLEKFIVVTDEAFDSYPLNTRCLQQGMVDL